MDVMILRSLGHGAHGQALDVVWADGKRGVRKMIKAKMSGHGSLRGKLLPQREQTAFKELNFLRAVTVAKSTNLITLLVSFPAKIMLLSFNTFIPYAVCTHYH